MLHIYTTELRLFIELSDPLCLLIVVGRDMPEEAFRPRNLTWLHRPRCWLAESDKSHRPYTGIVIAKSIFCSHDLCVPPCERYNGREGGRCLARLVRRSGSLIRKVPLNARQKAPLVGCKFETLLGVASFNVLKATHFPTHTCAHAIVCPNLFLPASQCDGGVGEETMQSWRAFVSFLLLRGLPCGFC